MSYFRAFGLLLIGLRVDLTDRFDDAVGKMKSSADVEGRTQDGCVTERIRESFVRIDMFYNGFVIGSFVSHRNVVIVSRTNISPIWSVYFYFFAKFIADLVEGDILFGTYEF